MRRTGMERLVAGDRLSLREQWWLAASALLTHGASGWLGWCGALALAYWIWRAPLLLRFAQWSGALAVACVVFAALCLLPLCWRSR